jgi:hypothetical protein
VKTKSHGLRNLGTLFDAGTGTGLTDGQLMKRFARRGEAASELAFAALLERHGPMVLGVCRKIVRDENQAEDAFQATFLVLAIKGNSLWVHNSPGPWLHRVACRIAVRTRLAARRRGEAEHRAARDECGNFATADRDEVGRMVHEAVALLPVRYLPRLPVPKKGINDSADLSWVMMADRIGYIYVRRIGPGLEAGLERSIEGLAGMNGLLIDVRGNSGGGFEASTAFQNFDLTPRAIGSTKKPSYRGPIALLIDERTISAGEGWASWFIANKRARVIGTTTAWASSRKETYTLSNALYKVVVPVKAYTGFLDRPIERRGLEPDVEVRCTAKDLTEGRDTVVDTAARWVARESAK